MDVATLGVLVGLVVLATGSTVWLVKSRPARERDPDTKFWYGFAGVCVLLPAILITTAANSWAGALLAVLAAGTWFWAGMLTSRHLAAQSSIREHARAAGEHAALAARHNAVLARWSRYELDPAAAIDFPAMTDVRCPETSALAKAVALAAALRGDTRDSETASAIAEYREAVALLESVFALAEQAATDPAPGSLNRR